MLLRKYALAAIVAALALALYLHWLWQPERQARLHTTHFLKKVEQRNWESARAFLADDYRDRWEHDRDSALADAREVFRQFLFLTIENRTDFITLTSATANTQTVVKITGRGGPVADLVMERVNTLRAPFTFTWRHASQKPWDWRLIRIDQPELGLDRASGF
jgi:hypothetical protein